MPEYGLDPKLKTSQASIPNDQTSDLVVKYPSNIDSGAIHLSGRCFLVSISYKSLLLFLISLARPKSDILTIKVDS